MSCLCINTHFDFDDKVQVKSACLILNTVRELNLEHPIIITGDFNNTPGSCCYKEFTNSKHAGDKFKEIFADQTIYTHHGFTGKDVGGHLDWILYKGGVKVVNKRVINDRYESFYPSDHFPIYAQFTSNK